MPPREIPVKRVADDAGREPAVLVFRERRVHLREGAFHVETSLARTGVAAEGLLKLALEQGAQLVGVNRGASAPNMRTQEHLRLMVGQARRRQDREQEDGKGGGYTRRTGHLGLMDSCDRSLFECKMQRSRSLWGGLERRVADGVP